MRSLRSRRSASPQLSMWGAALFFLPLTFIGFHPLAVMGMVLLNLLYQFFLHTEHAPCLGALEWVLNTPTHHRVHHASNTSCLDKNFAGVFTIWDRIFGTFAEAPRDERLRFGWRHNSTAYVSPWYVIVWIVPLSQIASAFDRLEILPG